MPLRKLKNKPFYNDLHFFLIAVILLLLSLKYPYFLILLAVYLIFILLKTKYIMSISILLLIMLTLLFTRNYIAKANIKACYEGVVIEVKNENSYIIRSGPIKLIIYDKNSYSVGDRVKVEGKINEIPPKGYPGDFDYEEYLKSKGISYSFKASTSKTIGKGFTLNILKAQYLAYLKKHLSTNSYSYVSSVVFGDNLLDKNIKDSYSVLGISHILAISGMHIMLLYSVISFLLLKLFNYYKKAIPLGLIISYVIIIGAPPSAMRALLFLLLGAINENRSPKFTKLDILSISFILMLFINPYQIYSLGFILSYLVSFILIFKNDLVNDNNLKGSLKFYIFIYLITLPFIINMNNEISLISLILSPILSTLFTYILLPISYVISIFPILDYLAKYIFIFLNSYVINLGFLIPTIKMPYLNPLLVLIYYLIFGYILIMVGSGKGGIKGFSLIAFYLFIIKIVAVYNPFTTITFLDCGQGDSTIIRDNNKVIVVDAFNSFSYLKDLGIEKIDYLVLTHSDADHLGDYIEIINYYDVDNILYPLYDIKLKNLLNNYDAKGIEAGYKIKLNKINIEFISPIKDYANENMNSLVMDVKINKSRVLLCADITREVEADLVSIYGSKLGCDVLKVPHHGSITSSSIEFLKATAPSYSIISAGLNNRYHHPDEGVVKRLNSVSRVYNTINDGSITMCFKKDGYLIRSYR